MKLLRTCVIMGMGVMGALSGFAQGVVPPSSGNAAILKTTPAATNIWNATDSPARVYSVTVLNSSASDQWLFLLNTNNATVANNSPPSFAPVLLLAGKTGGYDFGMKGCPFSQGITVANSSTDRTLTNGSANFVITVVYDGK
jgi:hypothetical protein